MTLEEYLKTHSQKELVELIRSDGDKITQGAVSQWMMKGRKVPAERVLQLERLTDGLMSRHDLRPDLYPRGY